MSAEELTVRGVPAGRAPLAWSVFTGLSLAVSLGVLFTFGPGPSLGVSTGILVLAVLLVRPDVFPLILAVFTLTVHYTVIFFVSPRLLGFRWYPSDWILAVALTAMLLRALAGAPVPRSPRLWMRPVLAQALVMVVLAGVALARGIGPQYVLSDLRPFVYYGAALLAPWAFPSARSFRVFAWWSVVCGLGGSIWGIVLSLTGGGMVLYGLALHFARLIGPSEIVYPVTLFTAFGLLLFERRTPARLFLLLALSVSLLSCYLTYSRGTYVALAAGLAAMLALLSLTAPRKALETLLVTAVALSVLVGTLAVMGVPVISSVVERTKTISLHTVDVSVATRLLEWTTAFADWRASPVLGAGLGHLITYIRPVEGLVSTAYIHNSYLFVLCKTGLVGVAVFGVFVAAWVRTLVRAYRRAPDEGLRAVVLGWTACLGYLLMKSTTTWFLTQDFCALYFAVGAGGAWLLASAPESFAESASPPADEPGLSPSPAPLRPR